MPSTDALFPVAVCRIFLFLCFTAWVMIRYLPDDLEIDKDYAKRLVYGVGFFFVSILYGCQGPRWSLWYRILGTGPVPTIFYRETRVAPGYEPIVHAFASTLAEGRETSVQLAVYVKGELVIDLAGSAVQKVGRYSHHGLEYDNPQQLRFDSDNYSTVWSCSKVVTSILMAWLVDQGHLDYRAKICDYWPEFTGGGKEKITVEQLLKHNAGLHEPPGEMMKMEDLFPENIGNGNASKVFEGMKCRFPPKWANMMLYHSITRGWICNEIARRVDPKGRSLGVILKQEFTQKLGTHKECYLGLPKKLCNIKTNQQMRDLDPVPPFYWVVCNKLCQFLCLPCTVYWHFYLAHTALITYTTLHWMKVRHFFNPEKMAKHEFAQHPDYRRGETPAANMQASARAMAALVNAMATRDSRIFKPDPEDTLYQKLSANQETRYFIPMPPPIFSEGKVWPMTNVTFGDGGFCVMANMDPNNIKTHIPSVPGAPYTLGWFGFNGSVVAFHPKGDFAFCFQPVCFNDLDPVTRIQKMTHAIMECGRRMHGEDFGHFVDEDQKYYSH